MAGGAVVDAAGSALLHAGAVPATEGELLVFVAIGLLGGAHCLGMCGPLVTAYSDRLAGNDRGGRSGVLGLYEVRQHALFNAGRTISYAAIGAAFGFVGGAVFDAASVVTAVGDVVRAVAGVVVGVAILAVGARYALGRHGHGFLDGGPFSRLYGRFASRLNHLVNGPGIVSLGLVHGLLPCPILYPAFLYAFSRGSAMTGAVSLALLGLGTFPTLFLYGTVVQSVDERHRRRLHRALGAVFLVMGWMPLAHGLELFGVPIPHVEVPVYQPL